MEIKINNLLNDTVSSITGIINNETPADDEYMEDRIVSALKDVALGTFPPNYFFIGSRILGKPFYQNINAAISEASTNFTIIKILEQLSDSNMSITSGGNIILESLDKDKFYVIVGAIHSGIYKNLTIKYSTGVEISNCKFENCNFIEVNNIPGNLKLTSCEINNCNLDCFGGEISLESCTGFSNKYSSASIIVNIGSSLLLNIFNKIGTINFNLNTLNDLNIKLEEI